MTEETPCSSSSKRPARQQKDRSGVIFLASVPPGMTVRRMREQFEQYGPVGRMFLQPKPGKKGKGFSEGWIEFSDRRLAKQIAASCNNMPVETRKRRARYVDTLWNVRYLKRFKWIHLQDQLAFEKSVQTEKMRTEISQAKRTARHFIDNMEKGAHLKALEERVLKKQGLWEKYQRQIGQRKVIQTADGSDDLLGLVMGSREGGGSGEEEMED